MWPGLKWWQNVHFWGLFYTTSLWSAAVSIDTLWKTTTTRQVVNHALSSLSGVWRGRSSSIWKLSQTPRSLLRGWHVPMLFPVTSHTYTHTHQPEQVTLSATSSTHTHRLNSHLRMFFLPHPAGVNQTHGLRRKQKGRWQNKTRKGKLSFSTCQS